MKSWNRMKICYEISIKLKGIMKYLGCESLMTTVISTGTPWLHRKSSGAKQTSVWPTLCRRIQSILRHGHHDELQMNPLVSVGAEQIRPCDWTRPALHIWEIIEARFGLPSLPPTCENNVIAPQAF